MAKTLAECGRCRTLFMADNKELNRGKAKYCSVSCANGARSAARKDPNARSKWLAANKGTEHYIVQRRAHHAVQNAIRSGKMKRMPCEVCGETDRIHAHHDDYAKPLVVRWLCVAHHRSLHG